MQIRKLTGLYFQKNFRLQFGLRPEDQVHVVAGRYNTLGPEKRFILKSLSITGNGME